MEGFYTVNTPGDPVAEALTSLRKTEYEVFCANLPPLDADIDEAVDALASISGRGLYAVRSIIFSLYRLDELPRLKNLYETLFHLDFVRLAAIDQALNKLGPDVSPDVLDRIDAGLTRYLTPRKPRQVLPTVANLRRKLNALIAAEDPDIDTSREKRRPPPAYGATLLRGGRCLVHAEYDTADALLIDAAVSAAAHQHSISAAEALKLLVTGAAPSPRVVLHVYRAGDAPGAPAYLSGFGWVDAATGEVLASGAARTIDLDEHSNSVSPHYATPETIKRVVEGRDGTCRYPHCSKPANACQKDHCLDYADGGPTAAFNLLSLCQRHHNIKTDGRVRYILDPVTDDVVWLFEDGHWEITEATGPTAAKNRSWAQTVSQAMECRRAAARGEARRADSTGNPVTVPVDLEEVPF